MEELLNKLIEKGWKPFGRKKTLHITIYDCDLNVYLDGGFMNEDKKSFRELVSKESGLWQFVCENEMVKGYDTSEYYINYRRFNKENFTECRYLREYQYRVIESSLKDESELEDFLLSNIVIKDEE